MRRLILLLVAVAALAPVAASAGTSPSATAARTDCAKLRAAMGVTTFAHAYKTFGACVSSYAPVEKQVSVSATATCTTEQADPNFASTHGGKTFDQYYGTGKHDRNAFANCVAAVTKADRKAEQQGRMNPARTCRAERTQMTAPVFNKTYGKNANSQNAFGKCVSATAHAQVSNEVSASSSCKTQQSDANFASTHGGKTFAQTYGSNADQSNAFGVCVSSTAKASSTAQAHAIVRAAKACKAEQKANPAAFKTKYRRFSLCVASKLSNPPLP